MVMGREPFFPLFPPFPPFSAFEQVVAERLGFDSLENKLGIPREESN
jgi:hypothetical protein